ncbi:MAG: S41 family peptidase [Actinomycetota bacterium]
MFSTTKTKITSAIAALVMLTASFVFGFQTGRSTREPHEVHLGLLDEVESHIGASAIETKGDRELARGAIRGMLGALDDPYASYVNAEALRAFQEDFVTGQYSGVGLWLKDDKGGVKVVSVLDKTPAARAGILSGDVVATISGKATDKLSLDEVIQRIQGRPGTQVRIGVSRGPTVIEFALVREKIGIPAVESRIIKDRIGHVKLISFSGESGAKVRQAVRQLAARGARAFILDLRGNPGGFVDEAVAVASVFIDDGIVVSYKQRGKDTVKYSAKGDAETKSPLVVLVDEGSASASEIVAGAIQDRGRGFIVGTRTYGKGSVQEHFLLSDGSAVKLTIASYFTPNGRSIGGKGITPDIEVVETSSQIPRAQQILAGVLAESPKKAG